MDERKPSHYLALSGGVGGAKLALGLSKILSSEELTIVANTGDDFQHLGLTVCPDIDSLLYSLSETNNTELGWGQKGETWNFLEALEKLGGDSWFKLGDRDLATHILRSEKLKEGLSLTEVTKLLSRKMNIAHSILPMTDDQVRTVVDCVSVGALNFQNYFVKERCKPEVRSIYFSGIEKASLNPDLDRIISRGLSGVILCPSNPFLSIDPILSVNGFVDRIKTSDLPVVAVSNIIDGQAIKGPAAKMMKEFNIPQSVIGVARYYGENYPDLVSHFVLDKKDAHLEKEVCELGFSTLVTETMMTSLEHKIDLAKELIRFLAEALVR